MRLPSVLLAAIGVSLLACGGGGGGSGDGDAELSLETVVSGLSFPLDVAAARRDGSRLYVAEKGGRIRLVRDGGLVDVPFLDLRGRVSGGTEQGLLGLVLHPRYPDDPRVFVNYTDLAGDTVIASFRRSVDPDRLDPASEAIVLAVDQPFANHNGGGLAFGPDGFLYVPLGDGGGAGDPQGNAQRLSTLLGKVLRLDVDGAAPYAVPPSNPFVGNGGARPEIWAFGLRNPYRISFDRDAGDLYLADVGQAEREEIDFAPRSSTGGENYGWNRTEGSLCFGAAECDRSGITFPVEEYGHDDGCSVTGGYVYRGEAIPEIRGHYFYGDFCAGFVRSFRVDGGRAVDRRAWPSLAPDGSITSFGEDAAGEILVVVADGRVLRVVAR
jgi:glucose/arabinose dehydrogenase